MGLARDSRAARDWSGVPASQTNPSLRWVLQPRAGRAQWVFSCRTWVYDGLGWMEGWIDGGMDRGMDRWMDGDRQPLCRAPQEHLQYQQPPAWPYTNETVQRELLPCLNGENPATLWDGEWCCPWVVATLGPGEPPQDAAATGLLHDPVSAVQRAPRTRGWYFSLSHPLFQPV